MVFLAGCSQSALKPPAPTALRVRRTPAEVLQTATRALEAEGFQVTTSSGAVLSARRVRTAALQGADVQCRFPTASMAAGVGEATVTVDVHASTRGTGSDVQISSSVLMDYSKAIQPYSDMPASATDCVSSGAVEQRVADAIR